MKLPCSIIRDLLPLYHDSVCAPETAAAVEEHLAGCEPCQEVYHNLQDEKKLALVPLAPPPGVSALQRVKRRIRMKYILVAQSGRRVGGGAAAGVMVLLNVITVDFPVDDLLDVQFTTEWGDGTPIDSALRLTFSEDSPQVGLNCKAVPLDESREDTEWALLISRRATLGHMLLAKLHLMDYRNSGPNLYYLDLDWTFYAPYASFYGIDPPKEEWGNFISKAYYFEDYDMMNHVSFGLPPEEIKQAVQDYGTLVWERDKDPAAK